MRQTLKIAFLIVGSLVLQIAVLSRMSMLGGKPDLPLALIVSVALLRGPFHGEHEGQILSGALVQRGDFITQLVSGFLATLVHKTITLIHLSLLSADTKFMHIRFPGLILAAISNSILVVVVFWILKKSIRSEK